MVIDNFDEFTTSHTSPTTKLEVVTPDDATDINVMTRALNVATSGTVQVTTADGQTASVYITAGILFPIRVQRIWATGTTATGIRGLS